MTDLHCHILPGLDDGARDGLTSCAMAEMALSGGTETIVATPHCNVGDDDMALRCETVLRKTEELRGELRRRNIAVEVFPGMELMGRENLREILENNLFLTLAGSRYLLIEFDFGESADFIADSLRAVREKGVVPVLAHPERYFTVQDEPSFVGHLFQSGAIIQVNKGSVLGRFGKGPQKAADWILKNGFAHVMASDAHGTEMRTPHMAEAYDFVSANYSGVYADILMTRNPARIVSNRDVLAPGV